MFFEDYMPTVFSLYLLLSMNLSFFHLGQLKDGVGVVMKDRLFGGLSVAESFVSARVPPGYHPEVSLFVPLSLLLCTLKLLFPSNYFVPFLSVISHT